MLTPDQTKLLQMAYDQAYEARLTLAGLIPTLNVGQVAEVGKIIGACLIIQNNVGNVLSSLGIQCGETREVRPAKSQPETCEKHI